MGAAGSKPPDLPQYPALVCFTGAQRMRDSTLWDRLLDAPYPRPTTRADAEAIELASIPLCSALAKNNLWSRNFTELVKMLLEMADAVHTWSAAGATGQGAARALLQRTANACFIVRTFTRHCLSTMHMRGVLAQVEPFLPLPPPGFPLSGGLPPLL